MILIQWKKNIFLGIVEMKDNFHKGQDILWVIDNAWDKQIVELELKYELSLTRKIAIDAVTLQSVTSNGVEKEIDQHSRSFVI